MDWNSPRLKYPDLSECKKGFLVVTRENTTQTTRTLKRRYLLGIKALDEHSDYAARFSLWFGCEDAVCLRQFLQSVLARRRDEDEESVLLVFAQMSADANDFRTFDGETVLCCEKHNQSTELQL